MQLNLATEFAYFAPFLVSATKTMDLTLFRNSGLNFAKLRIAVADSSFPPRACILKLTCSRLLVPRCVINMTVFWNRPCPLRPLVIFMLQTAEAFEGRRGAPSRFSSSRTPKPGFLRTSSWSCSPSCPDVAVRSPLSLSDGLFSPLLAHVYCERSPTLASNSTPRGRGEFRLAHAGGGQEDERADGPFLSMMPAPARRTASERASTARPGPHDRACDVSPPFAGCLSRSFSRSLAHVDPRSGSR